MFFSGIRLGLPLFCASHATEYVRICNEMPIWRATASEAELRLYAEFCFTLISVDGKYLYKDKGQEKVNGVIRSELQDVYRPGDDTKIANVARNMDGILRQKSSSKRARGLQTHRSSWRFNDQTVAPGEIFARVRAAADRMRLWAKDKSIMVGPSPDKMKEANAEYLLSMVGQPL